MLVNQFVLLTEGVRNVENLDKIFLLFNFSEGRNSEPQN